jgi:hypothetical protein
VVQATTQQELAQIQIDVVHVEGQDITQGHAQKQFGVAFVKKRVIMHKPAQLLDVAVFAMDLGTMLETVL